MLKASEKKSNETNTRRQTHRSREKTRSQKSAEQDRTVNYPTPGHLADDRKQAR